MQDKKLQVRIYYEDTDCGGIVYHTNYLKYCERARSEMFFQNGISPLQNNIGFVVKSMQIEFLAPARLGDILEIHTKCVELRSASIRLEQTIILQNAKKEIFKAALILVCMDSSTQKITKIPQWAQNIFD